MNRERKIICGIAEIPYALGWWMVNASVEPAKLIRYEIKAHGIRRGIASGVLIGAPFAVAVLADFGQENVTRSMAITALTWIGIGVGSITLRLASSSEEG